MSTTSVTQPTRPDAVSGVQGEALGGAAPQLTGTPRTHGRRPSVTTMHWPRCAAMPSPPAVCRPTADNGTEMTAHAMTDWCRFTGVEPSFIYPASPWQNGTCESFNGRFRDEFLTTEQFGSMLEGQVLAAEV